LIIKLGAVGDVIRTTPILRRLKKEFPNAEITWVTHTPDILPKEWVDNILDFTLPNIIWLTQQRFDWLINLDKDKEAISLTERIIATKKCGFKMNNFGKSISMGHPHEDHKWLTGIWDDLNKANTLNYLEEIFRICGYSFNNEEYILDVDEDISENIDNSKLIVGLNTGCGARWVTRQWPEANWVELAKLLAYKGYEPILLGGTLEDNKNKRIAATSRAIYFGTTSLRRFFSLVNKCHIIVSQVTMAMHVAIALKKYLVLMNNIFNRNEFYLYDRGVLIEPDLDCLGCFKQDFDKNCKSDNCMELISVFDVFEAIESKSPP
jgi:heptosyltransferase-2